MQLLWGIAQVVSDRSMDGNLSQNLLIWHLSRDFDGEQIVEDRRNFYRFFSEHDKRRGTDFCKVFPEFEEFYNDCKELCR